MFFILRPLYRLVFIKQEQCGLEWDEACLCIIEVHSWKGVGFCNVINGILWKRVIPIMLCFPRRRSPSLTSCLWTSGSFTGRIQRTQRSKIPPGLWSECYVFETRGVCGVMLLMFPQDRAHTGGHHLCEGRQSQQLSGGNHGLHHL